MDDRKMEAEVGTVDAQDPREESSGGVPYCKAWKKTESVTKI